MNITEFAAYAGVSKAAVSRYFNNGYLSADKRAAIEKAMAETGYRPSMQAQMMRTRRTRQIGVIMPKLSSESCARMVDGISRVLDEQGYQLLLVNTANENERESKRWTHCGTTPWTALSSSPPSSRRSTKPYWTV